MMQATDIMYNISQLPASQQMLIANNIIHSIRYEYPQSLEKNLAKDPFSDVFGMWENTDIDATTLRKQAWGIEK